MKVIKELIGIHSVHIAWNVHFEAGSLRKEEKRRGGDDIPTKGEWGM